jgi:hypothetical protein
MFAVRALGHLQRAQLAMNCSSAQQWCACPAGGVGVVSCLHGVVLAAHTKDGSCPPSKSIELRHLESGQGPCATAATGVLMGMCAHGAPLQDLRAWGDDERDVSAPFSRDGRDW